MLGRKIVNSKWAPQAGFAEGEIPADTVTSDLRALGNSISLWEFEGDNWRDVALAMATGAQKELEPLDIAWLPREAFEGDGIEIRQTDGRTPVADLRDRHFEAVNLDGFRLAMLARRLGGSIRQGNVAERLTKREVVALVREAVESGRVALDDLHPDVRAAVQPPQP